MIAFESRLAVAIAILAMSVWLPQTTARAATAATPSVSSTFIPFFADAGQPSVDALGQAEQAYRLRALRGGIARNLDRYIPQARLAFAESSRFVAAQSRTLTVEAPPQLPAGWRKAGPAYIWSGDRSTVAQPLNLPLVGDWPMLLRNQDEIWVELAIPRAVAACTAQLNLAMQMPPPADQPSFIAHSGPMPQLKVAERIEGPGVSLRQKDLTYLSRRLLRLPPDEDWRYAHHPPNLTVLQRRLHSSLEGVEALDVEIVPGTSVEGVNAFVSSRDSHEPGRIVELAGPLVTPRLPDGRAGLRINLREALERHFPAEWTAQAAGATRHRFWLQEVFIFIRGDPQTVAPVRPVTGLELLSVDPAAVGAAATVRLGAQALPSRLQSNARHHRLVVDLRQISSRPIAVIGQAALNILPPQGASACALKVEKVAVLSGFSGSVPVYARALEEWSQRLGGPHLSDPERAGFVESPGIVARMPFAMLTMPGSAHDAQDAYRVRIDSSRQPILEKVLEAKHVAYRLRGSDRKEVSSAPGTFHSSRGAVLWSTGPRVAAASEGDLLVLEGSSESVDVSWPVVVDIAEGTWINVAIHEGAHQLRWIKVSFDLADGNSHIVHIRPNTPARINLAGKEVRKIALRMVPSAWPFRLKLNDVVVFRPQAVTYAEALGIAVPAAHIVNPIPLAASLDGLVELRAGHVEGLPTSSTVSFRTDVLPPLEWLRGLRLAYRLPESMLTQDECPLHIRFVWTNAVTERHFCPVMPEGNLFIPASELVDARGKAGDPGVLRSIEWTLAPTAPASADGLDGFELGFAAEGIAMLAPVDVLRLSPFFTVDKREIFAQSQAIEQLPKQEYSARVMVELAPGALRAVATSAGEIRPLRTAWFSVEQVGLLAASAPDAAFWSSLERSKGYEPLRWHKWLLLGLAAAFLASLWRYGRRLREFWERTIFATVAFAAVSASRTRAGVAPTLRWLSARPIQLNLVAGTLLCVVALGGAGALGLTHPGAMGAISVFVILLGIWACWPSSRIGGGDPASARLLGIWACWPSSRIGGGDPASARRRIKTAAAAVGLGALVWSAGYHRLSPAAAWGLLPAIAAAYAWVPELVRGAPGAAKRIRPWLPFAALSVVAVVSYALATDGSGTAATLLNVGGGLSVALAFVSLMRRLEPQLERLWPTGAHRIYAPSGALFFLGATVLLVVAAVSWSVQQVRLATSVTVALYCCVALGVLREIWARVGGREGE